MVHLAKIVIAGVLGSLTFSHAIAAEATWVRADQIKQQLVHMQSEQLTGLDNPVSSDITATDLVVRIKPNLNSKPVGEQLPGGQERRLRRLQLGV